MVTETPKDIDRAAIEAHAQRTVEQTALRKVRKTLDKIEQAETSERRTLRKVLIVAGVLAMLGIGFFWWLIFSGRGLPQDPPMQLPGRLQQKQ